MIAGKLMLILVDYGPVVTLKTTIFILGKLAAATYFNAIHWLPTYFSEVKAMKNKTDKTKIFYDGNCVICDWEISHYQRIAPHLFELLDISDASFDAAKYGFSPKALEVDMHVLTPDGELKIGVDAFAHIWSRMPKFQLAHKLISLPVVNPLAKVGYKAFTIVRPYLPKKK
jgi:predicted DCC family thiol-disulfide oxidoreductase YuxK